MVDGTASQPQAGVAIVTAMFGGVDAIRPQAPQDIEVDWICVTDDPDLEVPAPFRRVVVKPAAADSSRSKWAAANLAAKQYKLTPWTVTDRERVIWIDANMEVTSPSFAREALASLHDGIAVFDHPRRDCIYEEAEACLGPESQGGKYADQPIHGQVAHYRSEGHPQQAGLYACGVVAWDATDTASRTLGERWMAEVERWTVQDQLSLPVVARRLDIEPGIFPCELIEEQWAGHGYIGNRWLRIWPHQQPSPAAAPTPSSPVASAPVEGLGQPQAGVAIVTAMFGGVDAIRPQAPQDIEVDWICVTDDPDLEVPAPFRRVVVKPAAADSSRSKWAAANLAAKQYKLTPWTVTDRERVIWIDANMEVTSPSFAREALASLHDGIAVFDHPRRDCIYEEAEACLGPESQGGKYADQPIHGQVAHYRSEGHPQQAGLYASGVIARDARDTRIRTLGERWMAEVEGWTVRDQLSFPVLLRQLGIEPGTFPMRLIDERYETADYIGNRWLRIWPHLPGKASDLEPTGRPAIAGTLTRVSAFAGTLRSRLRRIGARLARGGARRFGFELVRAGGQIDPASVAIPRGEAEPFSTEEYEVVPKGRFDIVPRNSYSPVPDLDLLPEGIWERRSELGGVELRIGPAIELIETELAPFIAEFDALVTEPGELYLRNENYESVDAELLYAILRARKSRKVLELGSGFTTLLIGEAARRNAADGTVTEHTAYDPFPRAQILGEEPPPPTRFESLPATEVPLDDFRRLEAGDVLFVDTTHTVKLGSDVNYIVLDVLPVLAPGVIVHFHDVFMPWEYPRVWFETMQYYWAEQYLLQAFLAFNDAFEVLVPAQAVARDHPDRLGAVVPSFTSDTRPGALWLTRR
jgi:fermentation-respiration switch protein FrsA (DUF1100 family)